MTISMHLRPPFFFLAVIILFLSSYSVSWSETYYIDINHVKASDTNPGTEDLPWKYCPGMTGWKGSAALNPGDIVYFNSGESWISSFGNFFLSLHGGVIYDGSTWGSGTRASLIAGTSHTYAMVIIDDDHPHIETVFRGFDININSNSTSGIGINWPMQSYDLIGAKKIIENSIIHGIDSNAHAKYGIKVGATKGKVIRNVEISGCIIYNVPTSALCIYLGLDRSDNLAENVEISRCEIYDFGKRALDGDGHSGILLKNHSKNVIIEHNYIHGPHGGMGIQADASPPYSSGPENAIIRHNIIEGVQKDGIYFQNSGGGDGDFNIDVYGNIVYHVNRTGIHFQSNLSGNHTIKLYNNTLYMNSGRQIQISSSSATFIALEIVNNILFSTLDKYALYDVSGGRITSHSHNIYFRPGGGNLVRNGDTLYTGADISTSWEPSSLSADPLFINALYLPTGFAASSEDTIIPNANGLDISIHSPAKDNGTILNSKYSRSINSVERPIGSGWDIGATESIILPGAPLSPNSLLIIKETQN